MNKKNKGDFGYLNYKKKLNFIIAAVALLIIIAVFITGLIIFKSRNNYMTLVATVLVLPWAKLAIAYFVLIPHKECTQDIYEKLEQSKITINNCISINKFIIINIIKLHNTLFSRSLINIFLNHFKVMKHNPFSMIDSVAFIHFIICKTFSSAISSSFPKGYYIRKWHIIELISC